MESWSRLTWRQRIVVLAISLAAVAAFHLTLSSAVRRDSPPSAGFSVE